MLEAIAAYVSMRSADNLFITQRKEYEIYI